ncbi:MAG: hypothetical protein AAF628_20495 [Planctomycetota bacterium]
MGAYRLEDSAEVWRMAGGGGLPIPTPLVTDDLYLLTSNHRAIEPNRLRKPLFAVKRSAQGTLPVPSADEPGEHVQWLKARVGNYIQSVTRGSGIPRPPNRESPTPADCGTSERPSLCPQE